LLFARADRSAEPLARFFAVSADVELATTARLVA
jgi:hypothetical protein